MREREIYCKHFGPFANTTFVILENYGDSSFRISFDEGPQYNTSIVLNDDFTAFKFLAGTIAEIRVTVLYGRQLCFYGAQIPTMCSLGDDKGATAEEKAALFPEPEPECMSIECETTHPCPDPAKPVLVCPGGVNACAKPQG